MPLALVPEWEDTDGPYLISSTSFSTCNTQFLFLYIKAVLSYSATHFYFLILCVCTCRQHYLFFLWSHCAVYRISVPQAGTEAGPTAGKVQSPVRWTISEFPRIYFNMFKQKWICYKPLGSLQNSQKGTKLDSHIGRWSEKGGRTLPEAPVETQQLLVPATGLAPSLRRREGLDRQEACSLFWETPSHPHPLEKDPDYTVSWPLFPSSKLYLLSENWWYVYI